MVAIIMLLLKAWLIVYTIRSRLILICLFLMV
jgi:hypothetical protein